MSMAGRGLVKLVEEGAEVTQVAAKMLAYWGHDDHPDGKKLLPRLEAEIGDVLAAIDIVLELNVAPTPSQLNDPNYKPSPYQIDRLKVQNRRKRKLVQYRKWAYSPDIPFDGTPLPPPPPQPEPATSKQMSGSKKTKKKAKKK